MHLIVAAAEHGAEACILTFEPQAMVRLVPAAGPQGQDGPVAEKRVLQAEVQLADVVDDVTIQLRIHRVVPGQVRQVEDVDDPLRELRVADAVIVKSQAEGVARLEGETDAPDVRHVESRRLVRRREGKGRGRSWMTPRLKGEVRTLPEDAAHAPPLPWALPEEAGGEAPVTVLPLLDLEVDQQIRGEIGRGEEVRPEAFGERVDGKIVIGDGQAKREPAPQAPGG